MSPEDDRPLGDGGRNYYEAQFGDRIKRIGKPSARPAPAAPPASSGSGWGRAGGTGVVILVILVLRLLAYSSRSPSPPTVKMPSVTFQPMPKMPVFPDPAGDRAPQVGPVPLWVDPLAVAAPPLPGEYVPLLPGLCYRIQKESLQPRPTPGKRICRLLDGPARDLLWRTAERMECDAQERATLLAALNRVLERQDFYDADSFRGINLPPGAEPPVALLGPHAEEPREVARRNRLLLEAAYPGQMVPGTADPLNATSRLFWLNRARQDLEEAKRQFEPAPR